MNPIILVICAAVVLLPAVYVLAQYNALVALRNYIRESWSDVDVELKRRYDLIPNLVAVVKDSAGNVVSTTPTYPVVVVPMPVAKITIA